MGLWLLLMTCSALWAWTTIEAYNRRVRMENNPEKALRDLRQNRIVTTAVIVVLITAVSLVRFLRD